MSGFIFKRAWGFYHDGKTLHATQAGSTLKGPVILRSETRDVSFSEIHTVLSEFLTKEKRVGSNQETKSAKSPLLRNIEKLKERIRHLPSIVTAALPDTAVFFSALPIGAPLTPKTTLDQIIAENPRASFLAAPDMAADWRSALWANRNFTLVSAAKISVLENWLKLFENQGFIPLRIEPGPWAALRAAWHHHPAPSDNTFEIRTLWGSNEILLTLTQGHNPLSWQIFPMSEIDSPTGLTAAIQRMIVFARWTLRTGDLKHILLQGQDVPSEWETRLNEATGLTVKRVKAPPYNAVIIAEGTALGALDPEALTLNLSRRIQKPQSLWVMFPRLQAIFASMAVISVLFSMASHASNLEKKVSALKRENAMAGWAIGKKASLLENINKKLWDEARPFNEFVNDRLPWAPLLEAVTRHLPSNAWVVQIQAEDQMWTKSAANKDLGERFVILRFASLFPEGGRVPREIDRYLERLREDPYFYENLSTVRLSAINWRKELNKELAYASILCTPRKLKQTVWRPD